MTDLQSNPQLDLAYDYVSHTNKNIFLTGKAGTGKTTFLHRIKNDPVKRMVIVAPTGVAAINAGGMTIHSFFQLPFGPFLPGNTQDPSAQRKFSREKIRLIQSLDLLVIDEISMVRADLLDGIDSVLRRFKDRSQPFGGVQLLMIGDLHQLPPVVKDEEWYLLREHYQTPYFFSSQALQMTHPVAIELKYIFRQSDRTFIDLLNKVRDNKMDEAVLTTLNSRYIADFQPSEEEAYITLTAHNAAAQSINAQKLAAIPQQILTFRANISGDFPPHAYPADEVLECKTGAQVMFVKNDMAREKRFYNGKIGQITRIREDTIYVKCPGDYDEIAVEPVSWENIKYTLNEQTKEVAEEIIGTFTQYPLKLAWAITIHKSQGLTFERAIIDAQAAFAHGQVYVALSRCKSFEGIVLRSKIAYSSVRTDSTVQQYTEEADKNAPDEAHLQQSKRVFQQSLMQELFTFSGVKRRFEQMNRVLLSNENSLLPEARQQFQALYADAEAQVLSMAGKFLPQLPGYFAQPGLPEENEDLQARIRKASDWFADKLGAVLLPAVRAISIVTDNKAVRKVAQEALEQLQKEIFIKNACFAATREGFSAHRYLRARANAEIDFQAAQAPPSTAGSVAAPANTPHPALYALLKKWREDVAAELDVLPHAILPTKALVELVRFLPVSMGLLKTVKGIGAGKSKKFGADIINIILQYCAAHNIPTAQMHLQEAEPEPEPPPKPDTKALSLEMYKSGKSIDEIAAERGFVRGTIEGHLAHFVALGELDIFELMDRAAVQEIEQFFIEQNTKLSSEAKAHFGEAYSYGEIKMVLGWLEGRGDEA